MTCCSVQLINLYDYPGTLIMLRTLYDPTLSHTKMKIIELACLIQVPLRCPPSDSLGWCYSRHLRGDTEKKRAKTNRHGGTAVMRTV